VEVIVFDGFPEALEPNVVCFTSFSIHRYCDSFYMEIGSSNITGIL
jgi:hypothetical protein